MAHRWSHVIKAYADGYQIQFRNINFDDDWIDVVEGEGFDSPNFNTPNIEWRVKPPHELKYRVAIYYDFKNNDYYALLHDSYNITEDYSSKHPFFVQWLTDWVEYK